VGKQQGVIRLDPRDERDVWIDTSFKVAWNVSIEEIQAVVGN
jgi:hypothetical protein